MFERFIVFLIVFSISVIILAFILSKFSYGLNCRQQTIYIKVLKLAGSDYGVFVRNLQTNFAKSFCRYFSC